ncbi:hypothetical protein M758_3G075900 [Ceratodon purpureus]|nr:hypothetical protein M758_3G075900 [Ceratodon purpureus]
MADDAPKPQLEAPGDLDTDSGISYRDALKSSDTSTVVQDKEMQSNPPAVEEEEPAEASAAKETTTEPNPSTIQESEPAPTATEATTEPTPLNAVESDASSTSKETTTELGKIAKQIIPHILNLYNSCPSATDFDAIYAPNATFEDPLMQAHGVAQIKSAFYAMPKVFLDSSVLKYTVKEEQTAPKSGEICVDNLQQYKLLQLGPVGYFITMQSLIKLKVEGGKVVRHEDLWGGYRLWNRHTVRVPLVGRMAETVRRGSMLLTHVLMGFGKDHKTLDKPKDASVRLMVS